jgi:prolipoprotein diacylglyceryl transferase|tara:strand:- start:1718 stop:2491 length:774 start_codon:yes stop_codon:yes gene_type:complete
MFINNFDPVAFQVFSVDIRWYSLSYIFGLIFGWIYCQKILIKDNLKKKLFDDYILYIIIGIIIGGRLGYVIIYNPIYYIENLKEILMIWNGGMSFHGALIGITISTIIFCKKNNENIFYFLDLVSLSAPIGIFFGRISNFINSELYGRETDVVWSVKFIQVDNLDRHPSQIYEAFFEGIVLFIILNFLYKKSIYRPGIISSLFLIFYSIFRFTIEFLREPDAQIGLVYSNMTMGQIISILTIMIGLILIYFLKDVKK